MVCYGIYTIHLVFRSETIYKKEAFMKKLTALFLALLLALSLCTAGAAAADETVAIVLEPADDTLLTAEGLALFFVDRDAITEETETSVSWYKETTKDGKTERELVAEMPLIIRTTVNGARIYVPTDYEPSEELVDLVKQYEPEKDPNTIHEYGMHRILGQSCIERGLRYGACWHCYGIEFDIANGPHRYRDGVCTVCGRNKPVEEPVKEPEKEPEHVHTFGPWTPMDDEKNHGHACTGCGYFEMAGHRFGKFIESSEFFGHEASCTDCDYTVYEGHVFTDFENVMGIRQRSCKVCGFVQFGPSCI